MSGNKMSDHAKEQKTGLSCPQCGTFIETSIFQLLTTNALVCPSCGLRLRIDRMKSRKAFDVLRKVQDAKRTLKRKADSNVKCDTLKC